MDKFDEKVIGYESTKEILRQILDILKRPEVYKRKGISIPRGLLMKSDPGLGKSLLASILMEESERKPFVFRKTSQENSFLDELRAVFAMAKEDAPSILLLEDLNLYVESTSPYAPEWACLQACIDDTKDTDLFVIATTNDTRYMPPSLLRPGRFDYVIYLQPPIGENAENIVSYYLRDKDLAEDVLISDIVKAMPKVSCAMDIQASADIEQADKLMDIWLCHFAGGGFAGTEPGDNRMSEQRLSYNEAIKSAKLEELYRRAYKILHNNKYFLLAVQHGLLEHETLLNSDLAKIRESCI